jgi:hypothetical protein|tara:strand:- start:2208 stop:2333 length:126 start_codon:yes stop_codon:yes gene_type:complete
LDIIEKIENTNTKSQSGIYVDDDEDEHDYGKDHYQMQDLQN